MCFSAPASFAASGFLTGMGYASVKKSLTKNDYFLCLFPFIFGFQQFCEGVVWLTWDAQAGALYYLGQSATYVFTIFAFSLWPILFPMIIYFHEATTVLRKTVFLSLAAIGTILGAYHLWCIISSNIKPYPFEGNLFYDARKIFEFSHYMLVEYGISTKFIYISVLFLSLFLSKNPRVKIFSVAVLLSNYVAHYFYARTFVSTWCFFAAVLSFLVYFCVGRPLKE